MFSASIGGGDAAHTLYRHPLASAITAVLGPAARLGRGWNGVTLALAAILMSWDPAPTLAQRFESVLSILDAALPRRPASAEVKATSERLRSEPSSGRRAWLMKR
ncbi:MAG: hypothetical protein FJ255_03410 [Phycisphaerae bacterium]|nr:hypothetical protein [Phycisphaerae bacterium]